MTGVQTCALPISDHASGWFRVVAGPFPTLAAAEAAQAAIEKAGYTGTKLSSAQ